MSSPKDLKPNADGLMPSELVMFKDNTTGGIPSPTSLTAAGIVSDPASEALTQLLLSQAALIKSVGSPAAIQPAALTKEVKYTNGVVIQGANSYWLRSASLKAFISQLWGKRFTYDAAGQYIATGSTITRDALCTNLGISDGRLTNCIDQFNRAMMNKQINARIQRGSGIHLEVQGE